MATKKITALLLVGLLSLPLEFSSAVGDVWFAKEDRRLVLSLAARQIKLYEAKIDSDWETMYSMMTPYIRSKIPIDVLVANPHAFRGQVVVFEKPPVEAGKGITKKGVVGADKKFGGKKYFPAVLGYRLLKFKLTGDKKSARVESKISQPYPPQISPTALTRREQEHWSYINGTWYIEWDLKYVAEISGARTLKEKHLPKYRYTITASELSTWYIERALEFKEGDIQYDLVERALLLDPYNAAELISKTGINADELAKRYMERALKGRRAGRDFFALNMDMAHWYGVVGDLEKSYKSYRAAHLQDRQRQDPLEGMVLTAYKKEEFAKAGGHYIDLLRVMSVTGSPDAKTLEPYLKGDCEYCRKVDHAVLVNLATELVLMKRYEEALGIYIHLLEKRDGWGRVYAKIKKGKKVNLADALGKGLLNKISNFTYGDLSGLAGAAGLELFHPPDIPGEVYPKGEGILLESMPKLYRITYTDLQNISFNKALANISGEKSLKMVDYNKRGYLALFSKGGVMDAGFYPDNDAIFSGGRALAQKIGEVEDGTFIYLARLSTGRHTMHDGWKKSLKEAGADITVLGNTPSSHILVFRKGGGYSRLWEGFMRISKQFKPSNLDSFKSAKKPALMLSGVGDGDYIRFKGSN